MPVFAYKARSVHSGKIEPGTIEADNQQLAIRTLREQGYWVTDIKQQKAKAAPKPGGGGFGFFKRVGLRHLSIFARQFSTMINAGVSLVRCLDVLEQQTSSATLREIIQDLTAEIEAGSTLSRAMSKYPRVFSNLAIGLVRAGEVGGVLDESLDRLATFLEADMNLRRKIKSALTYPVIVVFVALGIVIFLMTFILPKFMKLFEDLNIEEFPPTTLMLKNFSDFLIQKWWMALIILIAFILVFRAALRTRTGKRVWDMIKLRLPVFGMLNRRIALARFSRTLSTLLTSGVPILQAMETVAGTVDNEIISDAILASRASIREGDTIATPLAESKQFPPMVVQMIAIGEETGALDSMLAKVADFYEAEVEAQLESLTAALEPVLIVVLGFMVGFIVISMFMPLLTVISNLSQ